MKTNVFVKTNNASGSPASIFTTLTPSSITYLSNPEFFSRLRFKSYCISNLKDENIDKKYLVF